MYTAARSFSQNTLMASMNPDKNNSLRVMSTPTWPVPYYERAFRHPANLDKSDGDINYVGVPVSDVHVVMAKELLKLRGDGYVVEAVEQNANVTSYITSF